MTEQQPAETTTKGFGDLGLDPKLVATVADLGYEEATPIQREAIPAVLTGKDVIGQAATGTGKTAAFALPVLHRIAALGKQRGYPSALVLVPTRELAMQVAEAMNKYGQKLRLSVIPIYGGHSFGQQQRMLERGVDVVVATPGRALDHMRRGTMNLSGIAMLTLDEADEMLDMGFADDLEAILTETPETRQTVLFSATLPPRIAGMVRRYLKDPLRIQVEAEATAKGEPPKVRQTAYVVPRGKKLEVLGRVLDLEDPECALVFCRTRTEVDYLTERLGAQGYRAQAMHGGISQDQRTRVIKRLKEGAIDLVIATDVAARGLHIDNLELVVNFDMPATPDSYVHRIGRVGRAGREGVAITLADPRESRLLRQLERYTGSRIEQAQVPTVADLRARRLELTRATLRETILAGGLEHYRVAVESLAQEHDLMDIALAAVKLFHQATGGPDEVEEDEPIRRRPEPVRPPGRATPGPVVAPTPIAKPIPQAEVIAEPAPAATPVEVSEITPAAKDAVPIEPTPSPAPIVNAPAPTQQVHVPVEKKKEKPAKAPAPVADHPAAEPQGSRVAEKTSTAGTSKARPGMARIYVGAGRLQGIQPQNLVGAVSSEGLSGTLVGSIEIADKYSLVEVPESVFEEALRAIRNSLIKGKKLPARRFSEKR